MLSDLNNQLQKKQLWTHQEWLKLIHYSSDSASPSGYSSQVDDKNFFLSKNGNNDPKSEVFSTLESFFQTTPSGNKHAQCRFVARLAWLQKQLPFDQSQLPDVTCKDYEEWRGLVKADRVTLLFPAYHLNSPSSMFGHTLLRLDPAESEMNSDWLSYAVNFGAEVNSDDNSLFYTFKGLTGGYPGYFIVMPYFKKIQEYNRIEKRDIWEYQLNLTSEEVEKLVLHLWELKEIKFDYYFFDENCSYRLLELLEVARPQLNLTNEFVMTAIPVDTVRAVERAGLIETITYRPSQVTTLKHMIKTIPENNRPLIEQLAYNPDSSQKAPFTELTTKQQQPIIETAYKYLSYQQTNEARDPQRAKRAHQLLTLLNQYPVTESTPVPTPLYSPENGHGAKRFSFGMGENQKKRYGELSLRMAFHSLIDAENGFLRGAQINMGNIKIRVNEGGSTQLQRFDLIDIFSLTPRTRFFKPLSWRIQTGLERQLVDEKNRLSAYVTGGAGVTYPLMKNGQTYALGLFRLEGNGGFKPRIKPAVGGMLGALYHWGFSTAHLTLEGERFRADQYRVRVNYKQNFVLSQNHALEVSFKREQQHDTQFSEAGITYHYYY
ncbi:MAG: DUF4105 domain-containing protein [Gammaproteobacteria bacterium]|nr:DUF4105 domain-containing protein [Gammaproteobacteria bacterium]